MAYLGGVVGAIAGFVIGILLVEVAFASHSGWTDVVPFALGVFGWLVGSSLVRRRRDHAPVVRPR
jgi:hypothetical protein